MTERIGRGGTHKICQHDQIAGHEPFISGELFHGPRRRPVFDDALARRGQVEVVAVLDIQREVFSTVNSR